MSINLPPKKLATRLACFAVILLLGLGAVATNGQSSIANAASEHDWLGVVNEFRRQSGLGPVTENPAWSKEAKDHSCYMLNNGISHDEIPGKPGYTLGGDLAGNSGNVAVSGSSSSTPLDMIELWLTGPYHAIGVLRYNVTSTGFGLCSAESSSTSWKSGATLDVLRGINPTIARPSQPIVFPGRNATTSLHRFIVESPSPVTDCGWTGEAGLPLIAMMPNLVVSASSTLTGPNGPIQTCTLHPGNTTGTSQAILQSENAVIVLPREPLDEGNYTASVSSNGGNTTWNFAVDLDHQMQLNQPAAPAAPVAKTVSNGGRYDPIEPIRVADTRIDQGGARLTEGRPRSFNVGPSNAQAVSLNVTVVEPSSAGYVTLYPCSSPPSQTSTINFTPHQTVANQTVVPVSDGKVCAVSRRADTDIIFDVNGYVTAEGSSSFVPVTPQRLVDTRLTNQNFLPANQELVVTIPGGESIQAAALNVTVDQPNANGHVSVYPCGKKNPRATSSLNYLAGETVPNSVVTAVAGGKICLQSRATTAVIVDYVGYFRNGDTTFAALTPTRVLDTRTPNPITNGGSIKGGKVYKLQIGGRNGVPEKAKAASFNVTLTESNGSTWLKVYDCGPMPATSTANLADSSIAAANGALVDLAGDGSLCFISKTDTHVIFDINGVWM